jgi:hypothetical protein
MFINIGKLQENFVSVYPNYCEAIIIGLMIYDEDLVLGVKSYLRCESTV